MPCFHLLGVLFTEVVQKAFSPIRQCGYSDKTLLSYSGRGWLYLTVSDSHVQVGFACRYDARYVFTSRFEHTTHLLSPIYGTAV